MSVLTQIEARSPKGIAFRAIVILLLIVGSAAMIYPFVIMLSGSMRSEMDSFEMGVVPSYFTSNEMLNRKFLETKYDHNVVSMNLLRGYEDYSFLQATVPDEINSQQADDLRRFVNENDIPNHWWIVGGTELYKKIQSRNLEEFIERLKVRYDNDLRALSTDLGSPLAKWSYVSLRIPDWTNPRYGYQPSPFYDAYFALLADRPLAERAFVTANGRFLENMVYPEYGKADTADFNAAINGDYAAFRDFNLPRTAPGENQPQLRKLWETFVREVLNVSFIRADAQNAAYRAFLKNQYKSIDKLNERWDAQLASFDDIAMPADDQWVPLSQQQDYTRFLAEQPLDNLYLVGPDYRFQDWLKDQYADVAALNSAWGVEHASFDVVRMPIQQIEYAYVLDNTSELRRRYAWKNFKNVINEIVFQGRPLLNTIIFVCLSLVLCLTLQPLAAYALSRFGPPGTWKIILIFMATMAFPPMVGMIPQFLILRKFYLLNTFIALVLPVIVNGYLIFLLKGFFDSLPKDLYEAALIDGAGEIRMFLEITMALSKPILAIVALQTFNHAWIAFMYPLLVCPKEEMHVLAIWLYQYQSGATTPAVFASILITSIPTLLIFLFTQRTIMRGIAVPAEK